MSDSGTDAASSADRRRLRCPACRARQPLQPVCRRCGADLSLLARALARTDRLVAERQEAVRGGDEHRVRTIEQELILLAPQRLSGSP